MKKNKIVPPAQLVSSRINEQLDKAFRPMLRSMIPRGAALDLAKAIAQHWSGKYLQAKQEAALYRGALEEIASVNDHDAVALRAFIHRKFAEVDQKEVSGG